VTSACQRKTGNRGILPTFGLLISLPKYPMPNDGEEYAATSSVASSTDDSPLCRKYIVKPIAEGLLVQSRSRWICKMVNLYNVSLN
jgi:hypothetical protein